MVRIPAVNPPGAFQKHTGSATAAGAQMVKRPHATVTSVWQYCGASLPRAQWLLLIADRGDRYHLHYRLHER